MSECVRASGFRSLVTCGTLEITAAVAAAYFSNTGTVKAKEWLTGGTSLLLQEMGPVLHTDTEPVVPIIPYGHLLKPRPLQSCKHADPWIRPATPPLTSHWIEDTLYLAMLIDIDDHCNVVDRQLI